MTIEDTDVIDLITKDTDNLKINLIISDHLQWVNDDHEHMYLLQEKINSYLRFYEAGEIYEHYPDAKNMNVLIKVVGKYPLNSTAKRFYNKITPIIHGASLNIIFEVLKSKINSKSCNL